MSYNLIAFIILCILVAIFVYLTINYNYWFLKRITHAPTITAFFGNIMCVYELKDNMTSLCEKFYKNYAGKSMYGFYYMRTPALLIRETKLVKHVLQTKSLSFRAFVVPHPKCDPLLTKCPMISGDNSWMLSILTAKRVKAAFNSLKKTCNNFNSHVENVIRNNSNGVTEIELNSVMSKFAGEIVTIVGFDARRQNSVINTDATTVTAALEKIFKPGRINGYCQAISFFSPSVARFLHLKLVSNKTDRFFRQIVKTALEKKRRNGPANDYLHWLLEEVHDKHIIDEDKIATQLFAFFLEGYEFMTTIASLTAFYLAHNTEIQEKVHREIVEALEDNDGTFGFEACRSLGFLEQVINETMRLHPLIGFFSKECIEPVEFSGSDGQSCSIKKGDLVFISNQGIHLDDEIWPDPLTFNPDRFDKSNDIRKFTFLPNEGPKSCVASKFNILMVKMMLMTLLRSYKLSISNKTKMPLKMSTKTLLSKPDKGLWVSLTHEKNSLGINYKLFGGDMAYHELLMR